MPHDWSLAINQNSLKRHFLYFSRWMFSCWGLPSCSYSQGISPWQAFRYPIPIFPTRVTIITLLNLFFRQSYLPPPQLQGVVVLCQDLRFWLKQSMIWPSLELSWISDPKILSGERFHRLCSQLLHVCPGKSHCPLYCWLERSQVSPTACSRFHFFLQLSRFAMFCAGFLYIQYIAQLLYPK